MDAVWDEIIELVLWLLFDVFLLVAWWAEMLEVDMYLRQDEGPADGIICGLFCDVVSKEI